MIMAWISVHEDIIGGKLRELSKSLGCSQNESIGILIRLWLWCINNADKDGRIIGANEDDLAEILNIGKSKDIEAIDIVKSLIECSWLELVDDTLYIHDWEEWQEPLYTFKERREKDRLRKKSERAAARAANSKTVQEMETEPEPQQQAKPDKPKRGKNDYTENFEAFWNIYPRKEGKGEAYKKYMARLKDGYSEQELITAAENYARRCVNEHTEVKYIKHAKTFLSDSTPFLDYLPKARDIARTQFNGYGGLPSS